MVDLYYTLAPFYLRVTYKVPFLGPKLPEACHTKPLFLGTFSYNCNLKPRFSPILYDSQNTKWPFLPLLSYTCIFLGVFLPFLYDRKSGPWGEK
jgi:hypothetical protein